MPSTDCEHHEKNMFENKNKNRFDLYIHFFVFLITVVCFIGKPINVDPSYCYSSLRDFPFDTRQQTPRQLTSNQSFELTERRKQKNISTAILNAFR